MPHDQTVRERQLARIRALMSKTTANGCTEAEAQSAAAAVDRLLAEYEIDLDDVTVRAQSVERLEIEALKHSVRFACPAIGKFCDCKFWTSSNRGIINFLGLELDTEIAEYLVMLFIAGDRPRDGRLHDAERRLCGQAARHGAVVPGRHDGSAGRAAGAVEVQPRFHSEVVGLRPGGGEGRDGRSGVQDPRPHAQSPRALASASRTARPLRRAAARATASTSARGSVEMPRQIISPCAKLMPHKDRRLHK